MRLDVALDTEQPWLYELNTRLSDEAAAAPRLSLDTHGGLVTTNTECAQLPARAYVASWSGAETGARCRGLSFLLHPVTLTHSGCGESAAAAARSGDYYGLSCGAHNRTAWCQRGYKEDVVWPRAMARTCTVARTGVDKSRCYLAGKLEITFTVSCRLGGGAGGVAESEVTYHLLQDDRPAARSPQSRVRRALAANPPFFKRPHYSVAVREEGGKRHTVTTLAATDPQGRALTYSMVALVDSRSQEMFSMDAGSGTITTTAKLDREFMDVHYLRVIAATTDTPQMTATTTLQVNIFFFLTSNIHISISTSE